MTALGNEPIDSEGLRFYFETLIALARGDDGDIDALELSFLEAQANLREFDIEPLVRATTIDGAPAADQLSSLGRDAALALVRDGITLGYINGRISEGQRDLLCSIAAQLGLDPGDIDRIEQWLLKLWSVMEEGKQLFGMGNAGVLTSESISRSRD